ncbi:MAG: NAD-dependent DNA ligase LigA [Blautia sp.]|nr:NAD-dependent DNA ligase LigA [Lachnoclostridium sp.]MCM1212242.1 NAD-dependent DNA ligase LigA [Blautia sp.]
MKKDKVNRIKELVSVLNRASEAYYAQDKELMSNYEYDCLYDELTALEEETGVILANSPTVQVGYEAVDELPKERHEKQMLSLGKTKNREELRDWLNGNEALLSWKLDGLTIVLTFFAGKLAKAVTRGNGEVGEVITNNAKVFKNLPLSIPFQGELILRGEAVITYSDFEKINRQIEDTEAKYKNPRNLCSGSVRQLNNEITASRNVMFYAFSLVKADGVDFENSREKQFVFLAEQGFDVVEYHKVNPDTILEEIQYFEKKIEHFDIPSDGLVLVYEDIAYGNSLGTTAKFPRDSIAFKWADELRETHLIEIEWSPSRTGLINPIAVFEPVELEGTTVSRASLHNISIMRGLKLGIGDLITVYKANMIIPQIAENLTGSDTAEIPALCPVCGKPTQLKNLNDVQTLYCTNPACEAKKIKSFTLFVSRDAMNIDGLFEATLEKFIGRGFIHEYADIFKLSRYETEITQMEGFGEKSYRNLIESIGRARQTTLPRLIYALGIANIGLSNAKMICRYYQYDLEAMQQAQVEELSEIEGVGGVIAGAFYEYFQDAENKERLEHLLNEITIVTESREEPQTLAGLSFVITGSLIHYENRQALKDVIEEKGGKVTGSVTARTACLINNDVTSASSKNKKAKELGVRILSEEEFMGEYL